MHNDDVGGTRAKIRLCWGEEQHEGKEKENEMNRE